MAYENKNFSENRGDSRNESLYSKRIKAGKRRTYFFDVRSTRGNDYFITITESKKRFDDNTIEKLLASEWWNWDRETLEKNFDDLLDLNVFLNNHVKCLKFTSIFQR